MPAFIRQACENQLLIITYSAGCDNSGYFSIAAV